MTQPFFRIPQLVRNRPCGTAVALLALVAGLWPGHAAAAPARPLAPMHFEPQDWTTPKSAWLINKHTDTKWNLWSTDRPRGKGWTGGVVLQGPIVKKDRQSPEEGAPVLHTRITGIPPGRYDVSIKAGRAIGVSLDGKTWRRYTHGLVAGNVRITDGVFEVWVDDRYAHKSPGPCYYDQITLSPRVPIEDGVANPRFLYRDAGKPLGWELRGNFSYDADQGFAKVASNPRKSVIDPPKADGVRLWQTLTLKPGHYLLKAVARTDNMECILFAHSLDYRGEGDRCQVFSGPFGVPIGISKEFRVVELPFFVEDEDGAERDVTIGVRNQYSVYVHMEVDLREITLERLGDTELKYHWAEKLEMKPYHGLATLRENTQWERPGRVIFTDTVTGAETWLMTQGEKCYLRAQGVHSFSPNGKYLYAKQPGMVMRTDGSARYLGFSRSYPNSEPWLAPWLQRRLPEGADPSDWVLSEPPAKTQGKVVMRHIVTGQTTEVTLPEKQGWTRKLLPAKISGLSLQSATHDTLVWLSDDKRRIGLSNSRGERFRTFAVKSISDNPSKDVFFWRSDVVWLHGFEGKWYVGYILNWAPFMGGYNKTPENTINPTQMWALPIDEADPRGIVRVVDGYQYWGMCMHPYRLEDGSMLNWWTATHRAMNAEAGFRIRGTGHSTLALEDLGTAQVKHFIGSYPCLDHVDFSHPDFIIPESLLYPYTLLFIDVKRRAMWPISVRQFHSYGPYTASGGAGLQAQNPSPDVTKIACVSSMLCRTNVAEGGPVWKGLRITGGKRPKTALDVYNIIVRYPQPPANVRLAGQRIAWDKPQYHTEIRGYNLYRSGDSGRGFAKANEQPIESLDCPLPGPGYYALTCVEHSSLESRRFSEELAVARQGEPFRHFHEAEQAELAQPMAPVFDAPGCSDAYAVAVQDRDLLYKARLAEGLQGTGKLTVRVPVAAQCKLMARVRALKAGRSGRIAFTINNKPVGGVAVDCADWTWLPIDRGPVQLEAGEATLSFASSALEVALDNILVTNDLAFIPAGKGNTPHTPPAAPTGLRAVQPTAADDAVAPKTKPGELPYLKLVWSRAAARQGVNHYNVYRGTKPEFDVGPATLIGSPIGPLFYDCGLERKTYHYRVTAVDAWGNESAASSAFVHRASPGSLRIKASAKVPGIGGGDEVVFDASQSVALKGAIKTCRWDFGDGASAEGKVVRHAYPQGGRFEATLTLVADTGQRAFQVVPVYVLPPTIRSLDPNAVVLVEAEKLAGQGDGTCQIIPNRANASGDIVSYWDKDKGHWLEWAVPIATPGTYTITLKYATGALRSERGLRIDGECPDPACKKLVFPGTGGYCADEDNWAYATVKDAAGAPLRVGLKAGTHRLRMTNLNGGMAVDFILFVRQP